MNIGFEGPRATARTLMKEGDTLFCALAWSEHPAPQDYDEAYERLVWTAHHWQHWLDHGEFPDHPWRTFLQRSALTLKGLSYAPTGAMVAAATTSLPETPGGERNWDYRYTWIRDSTFMLWGLYTLGFDWEANDFFYFIADVAEAEEGQLQIMYGIGGESKLEEEVLDHLSGYEAARPVRIGNGAYNQQQHDVWGAVLDSVYLHTKSRDHLPERMWPILVKQVEDAIAHWREPDRGIWEVRGEPKHFTSSKMMCWVALDRGARLAEIREDMKRAASGRTLADEIHADICENALDERGVFTQHYDTDELDASVLLMPLVRFLPADDDRIRKTVLAIADELTQDGLVLRYRVEETDDGLARGGGHLHDLLVLARLRPRRDRRAQAGALALREAALLREPAAALRGGDRPALGPPPRQLPAGVHPPGADQRGHARDPRRRGVRAVAVRARAAALAPRPVGRTTRAHGILSSFPLLPIGGAMAPAAVISISAGRGGGPALASWAIGTWPRLASKGDPRAFAAIYERHHQDLFRYCRSITGNAEDASDALQSTMAAALRSLPGERRDIALRPWLFRIAHNESVSIIRRRRPAPSSPRRRAPHRAHTRWPHARAPLRPGSRPRGPARAPARSARHARADRPRLRRDRPRAERLRRRRQPGRLRGSPRARPVRRGPRDGVRRRSPLDLRPRRPGPRGRRLRAHLRGCRACTNFSEQIGVRRSALPGLLPPLPAAAGAAILGGLVGGAAAWAPAPRSARSAAPAPAASCRSWPAASPRWPARPAAAKGAAAAVAVAVVPASAPWRSRRRWTRPRRPRRSRRMPGGRAQGRGHAGRGPSRSATSSPRSEPRTPGPGRGRDAAPRPGAGGRRRRRPGSARRAAAAAAHRATPGRGQSAAPAR